MGSVRRLKEPIPYLRSEIWGTLVLSIAILSLLWDLPAGAQVEKPRAGDATALQRADAAFRAGYAAMQAGQLEEARKQFAEAARLAPKMAEPHQALGAVLGQLQRPQEAISELEKALALKPGDAPTEGNLAQTHETLAVHLVGAGKLGKAEEQLLAGEKLLRGSLAARDGGQNRSLLAKIEDELGSVLGQEKKWKEAESAFREALRLNPELGAGPHMHLGVVLVEEKQFEEGLIELNRALQLAPGNAVVEFQLGRGLAAVGKDDEAIPHLEAALKGSQRMPGAALELGMAIQRQGRQEESIPLFRQAIEQQPHNATALANLGLALTQTGKAAEAVPFFQRALAETPNDPVVHEDLGVAELQQSHFDEAIAQFEQARTLDAQNPQLHYDLGLAYKLKDRVDDAVKELTTAARLAPELPDPPYTLGILYMQTGKLAEAAMQLRAALALRPGNADAWAELGSILKQLDRRDEAEAALRKAVELAPNQPGAHITLAAVLSEQGKTQEAAAERKVAAGLSRTAVNHQRAQLSTNAGNQSLQRGEIGEAVQRYLEAIAADPGYAEAHRQLAVAYERQGRNDDAKAERAKADAAQ